MSSISPTSNYYLSFNDLRSIHSGIYEWDDFIKGITKSIENRKNGEFPYAKLNSDQSVSFFLPKELEMNETCGSFEKKLNEKFITEQIAYYCKKSGTATIGGQSLINRKEHDYVTEYQFNLTATQLDSILKLNPNYSGYKGEFSILKLIQTFNLSDDYIRLFPVFSAGQDSHIVRAAGCQFSEMPSVQLLKLIPGNKENEPHLHYIHKEVESKLSLAWYSMESIINKILVDQKINHQYIYIQSNGFETIGTPNSNQDLVRIAEMDRDTKQFYQTYGNCSGEELDNCKSFEIRTENFLKYIKAQTTSESSIKIIDEMLKKD